MTDGVDRRQLFLPAVLPHEGMLPACLIQIAPDRPAATALISAAPTMLCLSPRPGPKTSFLAAAARHSRTRRCRVRSWPSGKVLGWAFCSWRSTSFAVRSGAASSHARTSGHTSSNESLRVRQSRRGVEAGEKAIEIGAAADRDVRLRARDHLCRQTGTSLEMIEKHYGDARVDARHLDELMLAAAPRTRNPAGTSATDPAKTKTPKGIRSVYRVADGAGGIRYGSASGWRSRASSASRKGLAASRC